MNSIIDLNNSNFVPYVLANTYSITGSNAGNTARTIDAWDSWTPDKRITISSLANVARDIYVDFSFSTINLGNVSYVGNYANIGILQISPVTWRYYGIRDLDRYNEAWANTRIADGNAASTYSITASVNDQVSFSNSFVTSVTANAAPQLTLPGNIVYNEDLRANFSNVSVTGNANASTNYNVTFSIANTAGLYGQIVLANSQSDSQTVTGNILQINQNISTGNIAFFPAADFIGNVANAVNINLKRDDRELDQGQVGILIGNTSSEFAVTTSRSSTTNLQIPVGATITDIDPVNLTYRVRYQQVTPDPAVYANAGLFFRTGSNAFVTSRTGDTGYIQGTRSQLNTNNGVNYAPLDSNFNYAPPVDYVGNVVIYYSQDKLVGNTWTSQASNVAITANFANIAGSVSNAWSLIKPPYPELTIGVVTPLTVDIKYGGYDATSYTQTWTQIDPLVTSKDTSTFNGSSRSGRFYNNGVWTNIGTPSITRSGTLVDLEANPVLYYPPAATDFPYISFNYSQTKTVDGNVYGPATANVQYFLDFTPDFYSIPAAIVSQTTGNSVLNGNEKYYFSSWDFDNSNLGPGDKSWTGNLRISGNVGNLYSANIASNTVTFTSNSASTINNLLGNVYFQANLATTGNATLYIAESLAGNTYTVVDQTRSYGVNLTVGQYTTGGMYLGTLTSSGNTWGLVVSPTAQSSTNVDGPFGIFVTANLSYQWSLGAPPFATPVAANDQYRGDLNTPALRALTYGDRLQTVNKALDLYFGNPNLAVYGLYIDDYYLASVEEMRLVMQVAWSRNWFYAEPNGYQVVTLNKYYWTSTVVNDAGTIKIVQIRLTNAGVIETRNISFAQLNDPNWTSLDGSYAGFRPVRRIVA
jgi:hypothetical protein